LEKASERFHDATGCIAESVCTPANPPKGTAMHATAIPAVRIVPTVTRAPFRSAPLLAVCAMALVVAVAVAATGARSQQSFAIHGLHAQRHAEAAQDLLAQRYAQAYGRFAQLADEGHEPSALMALAMVCHGPSMFGSEWSATPGQLRRWSAMAVHEVQEHGLLIAEHDRGE
jgi:hypothetical protein